MSIIRGKRGGGRTEQRRLLIDDADRDWAKQYEWRLDSNGYVFRYDPEGRVYLHRLITGAQPGEEVHHVNHDPLDNRRENLQRLSRGEHAWIHAKPRRRKNLLP